jgi:hypothetical protein
MKQSTTLIDNTIKYANHVRIGRVDLYEEDFERMKLAAAFLEWVEGSDTELKRQWVAFKAFKRIAK